MSGISTNSIPLSISIQRPAMAARRQSVLCLAALALFLAFSKVGRPESPRPSNGSGATSPRGSVVSVGCTVSDIDRSIAFYQQVLDFECIARTELAGAEFEQLTGVFGARALVARLKLGDEIVELIQYLAPRGRPMPADSRSNDLWFQHVAIIVRDMNEAYARLRQFKVEHASSGPQRLPDWNQAAGGIQAFYFRDPDGHFLEILQFPPDKGDRKWHRIPDRLFLGIDHTAIAVSDTESSLAFYRDQLGLTVSGTSENHGTEQEHLNHVFGARLQITTLRGESGPGVELLEYLSPRDGRPWPVDAKTNDILHWQTLVRVPDLNAASRLLRQSRTTFVSPDIVSGNVSFESGRRVLIRDPDGHAIELAQP